MMEIGKMRERMRTMKYTNEDLYIGNWVNEIKNGNGVIIYRNGDQYEGNWINGVKEGKGLMKYINGNELEGE